MLIRMASGMRPFWSKIPSAANKSPAKRAISANFSVLFGIFWKKQEKTKRTMILAMIRFLMN